MAVVNKDGIIANKMSLAQYRTLKADNQLVNNEIYTFTDIDEYIYTYKESLDNSNPIVLRNLETGIYKIYGYFRYYSAQSGISAVDPFAYIIIEKGSSYSYATIISSNSANRYKITDSSYENLDDSGWNNATLTSGFKNYGGSSSNAPQYRKVGGVVEVRGILSPTTALEASNTGVTMFTLPSGFRPSRNTYAICQGSGRNVWLLSVTTGGEVQVSRYGTTGNASIPTSAWLVLNITFTV